MGAEPWRAGTELSRWRDGERHMGRLYHCETRQEAYRTRQGVLAHWTVVDYRRNKGTDRDENGPKNNSSPRICSKPQYFIEVCAIVWIRPHAHRGAIGNLRGENCARRFRKMRTNGLLLGATGTQLLLDGVPLEGSPAEKQFAQLLSAAGLASLQFQPM